MRFRGRTVRVALPRFGEKIAPCFEYTTTIAIFTIVNGLIDKQADFILQSRERLDRLRLLKDQRVQVLVCGGIEAHFEQMVEAAGIEIHSWMSGTVDEILNSLIEDPGWSRGGRDRERRLISNRPTQGGLTAASRASVANARP
jgi:predicted Fe-Mo cluster-binding NifX family protein